MHLLAFIQVLTETGRERRIEQMLKPPAQNDHSPATTKERIVAAALETLKEEGFAGTSARAIARRGGFNQALIFYHFGSLNDLLLAALDGVAEERRRRYEEVLGALRSPLEVAARARELYAEDIDSGHSTVVA